MICNSQKGNAIKLADILDKSNSVLVTARALFINQRQISFGTWGLKLQSNRTNLYHLKVTTRNMCRQRFQLRWLTQNFNLVTDELNV